MTLLLDTHILHWFSAEPDRLSSPARQAIEAADGLAVAGITWYELAWLAANGRIGLEIPVRTWLERLGDQILTLGVTPGIAHSALSLPSSFPGDPADRIIYATAIEGGFGLVTKDRRLRSHPHPSNPTIW